MFVEPGGPVRRSIRVIHVFRISSVILAGGVLVAAAGCQSPEVAAKQWEEIQTAEQSVADLRSYTAELESSIDSLRKVVARQDSALRIIVDFTGAQVPGYRGSN
jgi:hypothetical protein